MLGLTKWNPFDELTSLHREMDRLFGRAFGELPTPAAVRAFVPSVELFSDKDAWHLQVALPGIDPKDVTIEVKGNTLAIKGERKPQAERQGESFVSEIAYGAFERTITLPETIEAEKVTASYRHGMLDLTLPLRESVKPRRIEIAAPDAKSLKAA